VPEDQVKIKKTSEESEAVVSRSDGDYYPYGTSLSVEDDMIDELKAESFVVGDVVEVRGYAFVDSTSQHMSKDHSSKSLNLQLTSLKLILEKDDRAESLYGGK
jgi:hypothetical protein